jgi:hypothetical protein
MIYRQWTKVFGCFQFSLYIFYINLQFNFFIFWSQFMSDFDNFLIDTSKIGLNWTGLDINVCPIPVKTDVGQVDLVLWLSDRTSEKIRDSQTCRYDGQIYFHWYKILGLLYKRALFDLQFVHNLFWLKLKWNAWSKLFYCIIYRSSIWSSRTLTKLKSQSQKRFNERKYQYLKY